jgi:hypothetical protein
LAAPLPRGAKFALGLELCARNFYRPDESIRSTSSLDEALSQELRSLGFAPLELGEQLLGAAGALSVR